jgi:hypothetical protein
MWLSKLGGKLSLSAVVAVLISLSSLNAQDLTGLLWNDFWSPIKTWFTQWLRDSWIEETYNKSAIKYWIALQKAFWRPIPLWSSIKIINSEDQWVEIILPNWEIERYSFKYWEKSRIVAYRMMSWNARVEKYNNTINSNNINSTFIDSKINPWKGLANWLINSGLFEDIKDCYKLWDLWMQQIHNLEEKEWVTIKIQAAPIKVANSWEYITIILQVTKNNWPLEALTILVSKQWILQSTWIHEEVKVPPYNNSSTDIYFPTGDELFDLSPSSTTQSRVITPTRRNMSDAFIPNIKWKQDKKTMEARERSIQPQPTKTLGNFWAWWTKQRSVTIDWTNRRN